uniref:PAP-associated domain-containing protein n=1 Tax=Panagrellus redivivus TaxID=6233 RepID=A0A7E4VW20_PANRE
MSAVTAAMMALTAAIAEYRKNAHYIRLFWLETNYEERQGSIAVPERPSQLIGYHSRRCVNLCRAEDIRQHSEYMRYHADLIHLEFWLVGANAQDVGRQRLTRKTTQTSLQIIQARQNDYAINDGFGLCIRRRLPVGHIVVRSMLEWVELTVMVPEAPAQISIVASSHQLLLRSTMSSNQEKEVFLNEVSEAVKAKGTLPRPSLLTLGKDVAVGTDDTNISKDPAAGDADATVKTEPPKDNVTAPTDDNDLYVDDEEDDEEDEADEPEEDPAVVSGKGDDVNRAKPLPK